MHKNSHASRVYLGFEVGFPATFDQLRVDKKPRAARRQDPNNGRVAVEQKGSD